VFRTIEKGVALRWRKEWALREQSSFSILRKSELLTLDDTPFVRILLKNL